MALSAEEQRLRVFRIVRQFEAQGALDGRMTIRVELLADMAARDRYFCRASRLETYCLTPRFSGHDQSPIGERSDDDIWVDWSYAVPDEVQEFRERRQRDAVARVLAWLTTLAAASAPGAPPNDK